LLGFGSVWYREAFETATLQTLPSGKRIHMITGPYFLACKLAAFRSRGEGDYLMSHDMEDIVAVLDGRPEGIGYSNEKEAMGACLLLTVLTISGVI
jgi:predicted nucleotidyltransferase